MAKIIKLGEYKGIEVNLPKQVVTNEEVDQQIAAFVAQHPKFTEKDGEIVNGDTATIDFEGFKDGVAFEGGKGENYPLEIGSGQFIPGFEEQMIGMKKGESRDLNLTFPENYGTADLAGQDVVFKVTVHKIEVKEETELNDEFVASLNIPETNTVEDLKNQMNIHLQNQYDQAHRTQLENMIFDQLIQASEVEVTDEDTQNAMQLQINHIQMDLARQGMMLDQYLQMMGMDQETLKQQLEPSAIQQAKFESIIDEIVVVENLQTTDEEINQQVEMIAAQNQMTPDQVLEKVSAEDLKRDFNRLKASQFVIENAKVSE